MFLGFIVKIVGEVLLLNAVPESLTLLMIGAGLVGATFGLRKIFDRHDAGKENGNSEDKQ